MYRAGAGGRAAAGGLPYLRNAETEPAQHAGGSANTKEEWIDDKWSFQRRDTFATVAPRRGCELFPILAHLA